MARKSPENTKSRHSKAADIPSYARMASMAVFAIFAFAVLFGLCADYLRKVEDLSIFMSGWRYFRDCLLIPGGLLTWLATFLTQFFYHPALGAAVLTGLLLGLWLLLSTVFRLPQRLFALAGIPSAMLLLAALMPGYLIYTVKTPGFIYMAILGAASATALFGLYDRCGQAWWRGGVALLIAACYPLLGFYALLALVLCMGGEVARRRVWWTAALCAALCVAVPQIYFYFADSHLMHSQAYLSGLPRFGIDGLRLWVPYLVAFSALVAGAVLCHHWNRQGRKPARTAIICSLALLCALAAVPTFRYNDANFSTFLKIDHAITQGDYAGAVAAARGLGEEPTRVNGLYTHAAMFHLGIAGDSLFAIPMSDAPYNTPLADMALRLTCSRGLNYRFGRINDCYRWCMEDMVEYGPKVEYIKYMAKCALLNGETALARRYLRMLSKTMYHRQWAERYMRYADDPSLIDSDPEFASIRPLMAYKNHIGGDGALIETYLSSTLAAMAGGPPPLVELSMQFNMIRKDIGDFWPRFILYARTHDRIPRHYQEAAILFSSLEGKVDWKSFGIDAEVAERFNRFRELAAKNSHYSTEANREIFRPLFGDTYWYYYFFTTGLKTT